MSEALQVMSNGGYIDLEEEKYIPDKEFLYLTLNQYTTLDYAMFKKNPNRFLRPPIVNWCAFQYRTAVEYGYPKELLLEKGIDPDKEFEPLLPAPDCYEDSPNFLDDFKMDIAECIQYYMGMFGNYTEYMIAAENKIHSVILKWMEDHNIEILPDQPMDCMLSNKEKQKIKHRILLNEDKLHNESVIISLITYGGYFDVVKKEYIATNNLTSGKFRVYEKEPERYLKPLIIDQLSLNAQAASNVGITDEQLKTFGFAESDLKIKLVPQRILAEKQQKSYWPAQEAIDIYRKLYVYLKKMRLVDEFIHSRCNIERKIASEWMMKANITL